jgi:chromosome segregation ATPase
MTGKRALAFPWTGWCWQKRLRRILPRSIPPQASPDIPQVVVALEAAIVTLRGQIERANALADQAEARADRAEQARETERGRTDALRDQVDGLQREARAAATAAQAQQDRLATIGGDLVAARATVEQLRTDLAQAESKAQAAEARRHWWRRLRRRGDGA